jgi:hypothetical protein
MDKPEKTTVVRDRRHDVARRLRHAVRHAHDSMFSYVTNRDNSSKDKPQTPARRH